MKNLLIFLSLSVLTTCGTQKKADNNSDSSDTVKITETQTGVKVDNGLNTAIFDKNCVIFLMPDSIELANMQSNNDDGSYDEYVADLTWYPGVAGEVLDSFNIENIYCDKEIIILRNSKKTESKFKRKEIEGDMILFNIDKDPIISSAIDFDRDGTLKYFDK